MGAGGAVVFAIAIVGAMLFRSEVARRGRLEQASDPYRAMGFTLVETSSRGEPSKLEASVPAGCILATSTVTGAKIKVTHAGGAVEGPGPVVLCLCEGEQVKVSAEGVGPGEGVTLVRTDASTIGGSSAFPFLPFKPGATAVADGACADASLDAWVDAKKFSRDPSSPSSPVASIDADASAKWLAADPKRAALASVGMAPAGVLKKGQPFAVLDVPAETCVLVANESDEIGLRLKGGEYAVPKSRGNLGWCTSAATTVLVQRAGSAAAGAAVTIAAGPAARVGGLYGLREVASSAGLGIDAASVSVEDHGWSAKQTLVASSIPETLITVASSRDIGSDPEARIVALSTTKPNAFVPETPPDTYSFCDPLLATSTSSVCVFSGSQKWRIEGADAAGGLARAKPPFWLFALQGVNEPNALKIETTLISLARRLRRERFEPTTLDAVTELDKGAEVLGRANEDAIVAVGLAPTEPWVIPYTNGPAWSIDGSTPVAIVPIKPLERVVVNAITAPGSKPLPPKNTRRTIVFRRRAAP